MGAIIVIVIIAFVVLLFIANAHDNKPEQKKKREDAFARSMGYDPDSSEYALLKMKAQLNQMDANLQKKEQKKETAQIIKGAVAGGIVAGDVGAVVGAVAAKNKVEGERDTKPKSNEQQIIDLQKSNLEAISTAMKETPKSTPSNNDFGFSDSEKSENAEFLLSFMEEGTQYTASDLVELVPILDLDKQLAVTLLGGLVRAGYVERTPLQGKVYYVRKKLD